MPKTIESRPFGEADDAEAGDVGGAAPITTYRADFTAGSSLPPHRHQRGQLIYAAHGIMTVTTGEAAWMVPPTQALWMPPEMAHAIRMNGKVAMRTLYLSREAGRAMPESPTVLLVSPLLRELIRRLTAPPRGVASTAGEDRDAEDSARAHVTALALAELRQLPSLKLRLPMPKDPRLLRLCGVLLERPGEKRTLAALARASGGSARNVARLFQEELGMSFTAWRRQARLMEALLRLDGGAPVTQVALDLGYATPSAFGFMFRRALGVTPSRFFAVRKTR